MRFLRIALPFLFVRNWYSGEWELSRSRLMLLGAFFALFILAVIIVIVLIAPTEYTATK